MINFYDLINEYKIEQIDRSYSLDINLEELTDLKKNTIFFGCKNKSKRSKILSCKNNVIIIWTKYDFEKNKLYKNRIFLEKIKDFNNIKHYFLIHTKLIKVDIKQEDLIKKFIDTILESKNILNTDSKNFPNICIKNTFDIEQTENKIYTKIIGGFGNQLFMVLNIISLSHDYNKKFYINFDEEYKDSYFKKYKVLRKNSNEYKIFNNIEFNLLKNEEIRSFDKYTESKFKYSKIELEDNKNYTITGYFQSYKYFFHNKKIIKRYLNIDYRKLYEIYKKININNKKTLAIHIRLGDYTKKEDYHSISSINYYKDALKKIKLDDYNIILFSDDLVLAKEKLKDLKLNLIEANSLFEDDEDQFYILCLSDIRICANSTFSLLSCYLNEIYNFNKEAKYILPKQWFGKTGPDYDIYDIVPKENKKFILL
jgi:hypothetical protein